MPESMAKGEVCPSFIDNEVEDIRLSLMVEGFGSKFWPTEF